MKNIIFLFTVYAVLVSCSCKQQKKVVTANPPANAESVKQSEVPLPVSDISVEVVTDNQANESSTNLYRLVIAFTSRGEGVDGVAGDKLLQLIREHESTFGKPLRYDRFQRGREGEYTLCFKMLSETEKSQNNFIDKVKQELGKNELVIISENVEYKK